MGKDMTAGLMHDANKVTWVEVYQVSIAEQGVRSGVCLRPELRCTGEGCGNDQVVWQVMGRLSRLRVEVWGYGTREDELRTICRETWNSGSELGRPRGQSPDIIRMHPTGRRGVDRDISLARGRTYHDRKP